MPIYVYECGGCKLKTEVLQLMGTNELDCPKCRLAMVKQLTCQSLVYMNGPPSFRKQWLGTAPYTTRDTSPKVDALGRAKGWQGSPDPRGKIEGAKWLESIE